MSCAAARSASRASPLFLLHIPLLADPGAEVPDWWSDAGQGGGWLGAHGSHVIDQIHTTLGEFASVSASLPNVGGHAWTAEDAYLVHFRLTRAGCAGLMQSVAADRGPMLFATRVVGTERHGVGRGRPRPRRRRRAARANRVPADLAVAAADPPPADLLVTAYDLLHSTGIDVGPYTRLAEQFRGRIEGAAAARGSGPAPATFADGVATMEVLDAIRALRANGQVRGARPDDGRRRRRHGLRLLHPRTRAAGGRLRRASRSSAAIRSRPRAGREPPSAFATGVHVARRQRSRCPGSTR